MYVKQNKKNKHLRQAKNLASKDEAGKVYKKQMDKIMSAVQARTGKDMDELQKDHTAAWKKAIEVSTMAITFTHLCFSTRESLSVIDSCGPQKESKRKCF